MTLRAVVSHPGTVIVPVCSVNGSTGEVVLTAADVGAATETYVDTRLSANQRLALDALVSPTTDFDDLTEATAAVKAIIDALQAT